MGKFVEKLKASCVPHWAAYIQHPWILDMKAGTLAQDKFQFFLVQDLPYLADFFRIYYMSFAKLRPEDMRAYAPFLKLLSGYDEGKFEEELLSEFNLATPSTDRWAVFKAREGYMNHLVRMAHEGSALESLVAMLPCSLGFAEMGETMQGIDLSKHHRAYQRWIEQYRRPFMRQQVDAAITGLEHLARNVDSAQQRHLESIFLRSVQHQINVFDAAWRLDDPWPGPGSHTWKITR